MKLNFKMFLGFAAILTAGNMAFAQGSKSTSTIKAPPAEEKPAEKAWSGIVDLSASSNTFANETPEADRGMDLDMTAGLKLNNTLSFAARVIVSKSLVGQQDTKVNDAALTMTIKGFQISDQISSLHSVAGIAPTSEASKETDRLQGAVSLMSGLKFAPTFGEFQYRLSLRRNFHEFEINAAGKKNLEYSFSHRILSSIPLIGKLRLDTDFIFRDSKTYNGDQRNSFSSILGLVYAVNNNFETYISTSNEGSAIKDNGRDSNISAFDDKSSTFAAGVTYVF